MGASERWVLPVMGLCILLGLVIYTQACNEAVCASLVSKCMLLKSCECNMLDKNNCTCCRDCHKCLAKLYTECCSCVGMCPETNSKSNVYKTSTVEELEEPIAALFNVLTEEEDDQLRWTTYTYPAHLDLLYFKPKGHSLDLDLGLATSLGLENENLKLARGEGGRHRINTQPNADTTNCTVAYMAQCMSLTKCRDSCQSMGAARYRWFHEYGCCECIGSTCLDYGKGEALCLECPTREDELGLAEEEEEVLAGEDIIENAEQILEEVDQTSDILNGHGTLPQRGSIVRENEEESASLGTELRGGGRLPGGGGSLLSGSSLRGGGLDSGNIALGDSPSHIKKKNHHHKKQQKHHSKHDVN